MAPRRSPLRRRQPRRRYASSGSNRPWKAGGNWRRFVRSLTEVTLRMCVVWNAIAGQPRADGLRAAIGPAVHAVHAQGAPGERRGERQPAVAADLWLLDLAGVEGYVGRGGARAACRVRRQGRGAQRVSVVLRLVCAGYKQQLNDEDLWELSKSDEAQDMYRRWRVHWDEELKKETYGTLRDGCCCCCSAVACLYVYAGLQRLMRGMFPVWK